ncbi:phosphotransferase [Rugosimonospora africana]|uniref:Aminoglycoside phosphotransferase domain-containing protein n=1 Tax=Rugosimonospora africana TaxID=556532 RepID=A0A8J3QXB3_9ACTN|nr:phosphotransferase [Rugosimonospora africana]GIH17465.1 hypothetical protein Raf01_56370 [Rugosimonospora africana]
MEIEPLDGTWQRVPRLDAVAAVARLAELTGVRLAIEGPCGGGEVGAAYVRWPEGRRSVLTSGSPGSVELVADYHPDNLLVHNGHIAAVVDWDGAGRGDRHFDLVTLRFDLSRRAPELTGWLDGLLRDAIPAGRLRAYWAHMSLRLVDWSIRHHGPAAVDDWLSIAETGIRTSG